MISVCAGSSARDPAATESVEFLLLMPPQGLSIEDPALIRPFVFAGSLSEDPAGTKK